MTRARATLSAVLMFVGAVLLPLGVVAKWANDTIYDSHEFSVRLTSVLDSGAVRTELASRITAQLARSGNRQAVNFRPAFQFAVEAALDTDTFRSIFRNAVEHAHQSLLAGDGSGGLNLSESVAIITNTVQLPENGTIGAKGGGNLDSTLTDITKRLDDDHFLEWKQGTATLATIGFTGFVVALIGSVLLATDRRTVARRFGWIIAADGLAIAMLIPLVSWLVSRSITDVGLADAVKAAIEIAMADLATVGLWTVGYGVIVIAAASDTSVRYTPAQIRTSTAAWIGRRRSTTLGTTLLGVLAVAISFTIAFVAPDFWLQASVFALVLWLGYLGVVELLTVVRATVGASRPHLSHSRPRERLAVAAVIAIVVAAVSSGLVITSHGAADRATASGERKCNGSAEYCDLRIDQVTFPGSHNSMSSALYPGWLFGEQVETIRGQLDAGIRTLLIDTHYGVPSSARMPGSDTPVVLTDRAAELSHPPGENIDPAVAARANELAARAPAKANAKRQIYLCHNFCELGAAPFAEVMRDVKSFIDQNPDQVVMFIIQDATTPADTAAAIIKAGLAERTRTLQAGQPLPTLGELIDAKTNLLVFAEQGGPGAPAWYQPAYQHWFQETPFSVTKVADFNCAPMRGTADAPLFLVNHWVGFSPPSPAGAATANAPEVLTKRLEQCATERGRMPNVLALDFAARSEEVALLESIRVDLEDAANSGSSTGSPTSSSTAPPTSTTVGQLATIPPDSTIPAPTQLATLTGGDPAQFCTADAAAEPVITAWAYAAASEIDLDAGTVDLVYGPALQRVLHDYTSSAPDELAALAAPLVARAKDGVEALVALGIAADEIRALADRVIAEASDPVSSGALTVQAMIASELGDRFGSATFRTAANRLAATDGDPTAVMDLGDVPSDLANATGFDCLTTIG